MPGPPPKRSAERRRKNKPAAGDPVQVDVDSLDDSDPDSLPFLIKQPIVVPKPEDAWHPIALEVWESLKRSGQAMFWEPSDWAVAKLMCESLSRDLLPQVVGVSPASEFGPAEAVYEKIPLKGASLGAYLKAFGQLMLTEGERRRLGIEMERARNAPEPAEPGTVVPFKERRAAQLRGSKAQ